MGRGQSVPFRIVGAREENKNVGGHAIPYTSLGFVRPKAAVSDANITKWRSVPTINTSDLLHRRICSVWADGQTCFGKHPSRKTTHEPPPLLNPHSIATCTRVWNGQTFPGMGDGKICKQKEKEKKKERKKIEIHVTASLGTCHPCLHYIVGYILCRYLGCDWQIERNRFCKR
ncbi:hypothetical protein CEXT_642681 [Caerostris extrusa]|uniref:Uncharacterized protein n=1 Tax=Caerostris extrusa TaxID=172846 RepID=A0AAV4REX2_CAEEX|nr:hypothetical protein CEXT_642681 [Caerostris extrusa]